MIFTHSFGALRARKAPRRRRNASVPPVTSAPAEVTTAPTRSTESTQHSYDRMTVGV